MKATTTILLVSHRRKAEGEEVFGLGEAEGSGDKGMGDDGGEKSLHCEGKKLEGKGEGEV